MDDLPVRRREFVAGILASAGAALIGGLPADAAPAGRAGTPGLTRERFEALLGSNFRLHAEGMRPATVKLVEVTPVTVTSAEHARHLRRKPFTILFHCEKHPGLAQDTYVVEHPRLGANPLLVTPVGPEPGYYEAIFS